MTATLSHDKALQVLPWYANGTLSPSERDEVEGHLAGCASCRRELESLRIVSAVMTADELPAPRASSLANMLASIDKLEANQAPAASWKAWLQALWTPSVATARFALVLEFALIVVLGTTLLVSRSDQSYSTLSGPSGPSGGARLSVAFEPAATEDAMSRALRDNGARIVSGPSALGIYTVELTGRAAEDPQVKTVIDRLRTMTGVVRFVELEP